MRILRNSTVEQNLLNFNKNIIQKTLIENEQRFERKFPWKETRRIRRSEIILYLLMLNETFVHLIVKIS